MNQFPYEGRVAIVHDWVTGMRGGEAILDVICEMFPRADLFTLLQTDFVMSENILNGRTIHTSYLQKLMKMRRFQKDYRQLLPIFPHAVSTLNLMDYDLILSNTHCVAKGVRVSPKAKHVTYVSTPMRYIWDMFDEYFAPGKCGFVTRIAANLMRPYLQKWDTSTNNHLDGVIANSHFVQERIRKFWNLDSQVIFPFFDAAKFEDKIESPKDFYLIVSAFAPYKRIDLAIEAFRITKQRLIIIGGGQDAYKLKALAAGADNIEFKHGVSDASLGEFYRKAKALVFPGLEDFGITPLESMYNGRPVIAYGKGGLLDTVTEKTGLFFKEQTVDCLVQALLDFEPKANQFRPEDCRLRAMEFSRERFTKEYRDFLQMVLSKI